MQSRDYEIKHSRTDDNSYQAEYEEKLAEAAKNIQVLFSAYQSRVNVGQETELKTKLEKSWTEYRSWQSKVIKLGKEKQQADAADVADGGSSMAYDEVAGVIAKLLAFNFESGRTAAADVRLIYQKSNWVIAAVLGAVLITGVILTTAIVRSFLHQLGGEPRTAAAVARAVAEGNLRTPIQLRQDDSDSLLAWLLRMQESLVRAVTDVRTSSELVSRASQEIASGNQDLSTRTERQAGELQQTAHTMEKFGHIVRTNADSAQQASLLAQSASSVAVQGGEVVGRVVSTMKGINESSRKIGDIIGAIDSIAFQTNILALNAAVEAARAGEQGRGFAVVASEVRHLAQRSAEAAKEIKQLISVSVERVEEGCHLVDQAGDTMQKVVASIRQVNDIVAEISTASAEQSSGVEQVGEAISRMDESTQHNAALVEQSAAAASSLQQQAAQLVHAVAVFKA